MKIHKYAYAKELERNKNDSLYMYLHSKNYYKTFPIKNHCMKLCKDRKLKAFLYYFYVKDII